MNQFIPGLCGSDPNCSCHFVPPICGWGQNGDHQIKLLSFAAMPSSTQHCRNLLREQNKVAFPWNARLNADAIGSLPQLGQNGGCFWNCTMQPYKGGLGALPKVREEKGVWPLGVRIRPKAPVGMGKGLLGPKLQEHEESQRGGRPWVGQGRQAWSGTRPSMPPHTQEAPYAVFGDGT